MANKADRIARRRKFPVILGDPIARVRSPIAFSERPRGGGCNQRMIPWHAPVDAFEQFMPGLMATRILDGRVITHPFKARVLAFATTVLRQAAQVGAAKALRRKADGRRVGRSTRASRRRIHLPTRSAPTVIRPERARD